ncbi:hypothetical protein DFH06DRAFT_1327816 [Mycena polygramma]|nr:hypothetical protein DFH06DRAFT_1327816 [Mycena polygramma]
MTLYAKLHSLSQIFASPPDFPTFLALRAPNARHYWGHNYLVSKNPCLQGQDNAAFAAHLKSTGRLLESLGGEVTDIVVDEHARKATLRMSYFLKAKGLDETVENDLIWVLKFTDEGEMRRRARGWGFCSEMHGELDEDVKGGVAIQI